ncbi:MAG: right-handed parallel beta-helix repeat-containing protein [Ruminococcus sp.]|nr:right-handed parallel beta-helix repeat-containing protein [Ruminococcus sp.]MBQ3329946.1 right-handed parallel beta-helix repeat-containing protein [Ruminococcus sp.]MBQ6412923.1 right-handed parallel beta-helix repeat-containing protein [Ruminococcus sp.]MBQ9515960.1 right-handed parallel beta-helix repeat-containing protein [Ruminococcus sp.]
MKKTSIKKHNTGSRVSIFLSAVLVLILALSALPICIPANAALVTQPKNAPGVMYKVEITHDSKASGWNSASLKINYKYGDDSKQFDLKDEFAKGDTITKTFELWSKVPQSMRLYLDFGGGFTVRKHSGRIKFFANDVELMNEEYSAWSAPFNSSDKTMDFRIWGIQEISVISPDGASTVYPTVNEAWKQAIKTGGSTVQLLEDATARGSLETSGAINFDFNGHILTNAWALTTFIVKSGSELSLTDSTGNGGIDQVATDANGGAVRVESGGVLSIKGCTFSNCTAASDGGAIHCEGSMTLEGTKFISCTSEENGGAISCKGKPAITFNDLTFEKCESDIGGAFCVYDVKTSTNIGTMSDCTFKECKARSTGGGLRLSTKAEILTDNLTFNNCWSEVGGGVYSSSSCPVTFNDAVFNNCTAENGGGFAYKSGGKTSLNHVEFNNCRSAKCGGGLYLIPIFPYRQYTHSEDFKLDSCRIHDCTANNEGGGIYVYDDDESDSKLNRVLIYKTNIENNTAEKGGGIYVESKFVYLIDSSVTNNQAAGKYGGGVYVDSMRDIEVAERIVIRNNTANGAVNNLCLQNGTFSSAKMYSGGLYDGSYIGISSTGSGSATVGKNISLYQVNKYLHADDYARSLSMTNLREVSTPLFASVISDNISLIIIIGGVILIAGVTGLLYFRKKKKEGKKDDEANAEQSDANDDEENE